MKKYSVEISQNGWEFTGHAFITANNVKQLNRDTIIADGVEIQFDEEIGLISEINEMK